MSPFYDESFLNDTESEFFGTKLLGWLDGNRQDAVDLVNYFIDLGQLEEAGFWADRIEQTGLPKAYLANGIGLINTCPEESVQFLLAAFHGLHPGAVNPLYELLISNTPARLDLDPSIYKQTREELRALLMQRQVSELPTVILAGTRPVLFQKVPGPPTFDNAQWGGGSLFVVEWEGESFAVTALHVIENLGAERKEFRLLIPGTEATLEMYGGISPSSEIPSGDEVDDIYAWHIKGLRANEEHLGWWSWKLNTWSKHASELTPSQDLFVAGFPDIDERYDHENFKVVPLASILSGQLSSDPAVEGLFVMDVEEVDHVMNLMSGGPVFARFDGLLHYVGMIVRGDSDARKIYFIDAKYIIELLTRHNQEAHFSSPNMPDNTT
ncbi:hypothetical protein RPW65_05755 [Pseudomonas sp. NyZ704]|nr:hypothetical protein RPW65_05755 [Pseudomonas sp. NyZ704]